MKKFIAGMAGALCAVTLAFAGCGTNDEAKLVPPSPDTASGEAYMTVDINPSVEFLLENDKAVSVKAGNADGATLISGETFIGLTSEECVKKMVKLAEDTGYLNENNADVDISVAADEDEVRQNTEERAKKGAEAGSVIARVNIGARAQDVREVKKLQAEDAEAYKSLSPAKYRLITAVMQFDETMTYEKGAGMSVKELKDLLEAHADEFEDYACEELKNAMDEAKDAAKEAMEKNIAELCGEEYAAKFQKYLAYKAAYEELKRQAENAVISAEDEAAIAELLHMQDLTIVGTPGEIGAETLEKFVDKLRTLTEETREAIEDILEKYDEDEAVISGEDLQKFGELIGEVTEITLDELDDLIDEFKDGLEKEIKAYLEENPELQARIEQLKTAFQQAKDGLKEAFKNRFEEKKSQFAKEKEERLNEFKKDRAA
ncbi:MAG: hypothetical protein ACI4SH_08950 [Candidatus Scatosoma sp.]